MSSTGMKLGGAPSWLQPLLGTRFFQPCASHSRLAKNECNHYCLNCAGEENAVCCPYASPATATTTSSRYSEVIRVAELEEVVDMSLVHAAIRGQPGVVYLNPRPQAPQHAVKCFGSTGACLVCGRKLVDAIFSFCSLGCKWEDSDSNSNKEEDDGDDLQGPSNFGPIGGTSYHRQPRKGVCGPPTRAPFY